MMVELPNKTIKSTRKNPKKIIIFSNPKSGKTTAVSALENNLILDLEDGSEFVDALKINILGESMKQNKSPLTILRQVIDQLTQANKEKGGYVYQYITVDTVSALEDIALELAGKLYQDTPMGRNWQGDDVTKLPNGAG